MNGPQAAPLPPQAALTSWIILTEGDKEERVVALGLQPLNDGSVVFGDQFGPTAVYNSRHWKKITRSSIQPAGNS